MALESTASMFKKQHADSHYYTLVANKGSILMLTMESGTADMEPPYA